MAKPEHVAILEEGVEAWNAWREEHLKVDPDLSEASLPDRFLQGANLARSNLSKIHLSGSNLAGANLAMADLGRADLVGIDFTDADLYGANLIGANLASADLSGANLTDAELADADVTGAKVEDALFGGRKLWQWAEEEGEDPIEYLKKAKGIVSFQKRSMSPSEHRTGAVPNVEVDIWVDPGNADSEDVAELYCALSELHRAHGGTGIVFRDDETQVFTAEGKPA
jgi:hypothetical protein